MRCRVAPREEGGEWVWMGEGCVYWVGLALEMHEVSMLSERVVFWVLLLLALPRGV